MRVIRCPQCGEPVPWTASYCANCGRSVSVQAQSFNDKDATVTLRKPRKHHRPASLKAPTFYTLTTRDADETQRLDRSQTARTARANPPLAAISEDESIAPERLQEWLDEAEFEDDTLRRATWQKFVTHKTPRVSRSPAPVDTPFSVNAVSSPSPLTPMTPLTPSDNEGVMHWVFKKKTELPLFTRVTSWLTILVIIAVLLGGGFGIYVSLGRGSSTLPALNVLSLQVAPASIAPGGVITLRGSHFSPGARVGLTRDTSIPIIDTGGVSIIKADASGSFSDTVIIDGTWPAGSHMVHAEDARLHKIASFSIFVTRNSLSSRPPHLVLSTSDVNLGSGDQATDSSQTIAMSNAGGGQITWQTTVTAPWLLLSPASGTFSVGQQIQVTLAVDRSTLPVGPYNAQVIFTSSAGQVNLSVKMQVTQLQPGHEAVLQLTPAVLSFTGVDGSASSAPQVVTVSNPGVRPLNWSASSGTQDGSNWLTLSPQSGTVTKGNSQPVTIGVNSSMLLPGVYYGSVTFSNSGTEAIMDSPQTIYVSVTILPQCAAQIMPGGLTFTAVYLQQAPGAKTINVGANQGCTAPLNWSDTVMTANGGHWLTISATKGITPSSPKVSVNVIGLLPGTYNGMLIFSTTAGTQIVPVTLIMGQPTTPILTNSPALFNTSGIIGQPDPSPQTVTIKNTGGGTLSWSATPSTTVGGAWLTITPKSGILMSQQTASITVVVKLLSGLIPGVYNGSIAISGTDGANHPAAGSPQNIPVTFTVQAPCTISTPVPALNFQGVIGQSPPPTQPITINASGACAHALNWTAKAATTWLTLTPAAGTVNLAATSLTTVGIAAKGLVAGTYSGSVTITAVDSVTLQPVGTPQVVSIKLNVQPPCMLQAPSAANAAFSSQAGHNPAPQTFTLGVIGACSGKITLTPTATMGNGSGWLAVTPATASIASNSSATFTITVTSSALAAGTYTGAISLAAVDSKGMAITGSPQSVSITLSVYSPPVLSTGPASLSFNLATGTSSHQVSINNTGREPLNWSAALDPAAPAFVSISSPTSGTNLAGGGTGASITITVNASGLKGGSSYSTSVTVSAVDPLTGKSIGGSPSVIPITINISPPAMKLSKTKLAFTTTANNNPPSKTITITNTGGDGLTWNVGTPSQSWLTVAPGTATDTSQSTSTPSFSIDVTGMTAGTYTAKVDFMPSAGATKTVTVTLTIN